MQSGTEATNAPRLTTNPMDSLRITWIASYPRSGNTWLRFLLAYAVYGSSSENWSVDVNRACVDLHHWADSLRRMASSDQASRTNATIISDLREEISRLRGTWPKGDCDFILKTHFMRAPQHPLISNTDRVVHITRHPLAVARSSHSFYRMLGMESRSLNQYLEEFIELGGDQRMIDQGYGTWFENRSSWISNTASPVLEIQFESLRTDTANQLGRILRFLKLDATPAHIDEAVELASLQNLSEREATARKHGELRVGARNVDGPGQFINQGSTRIDVELPEPILEIFRQRWTEPLIEAGYQAP